MTSIYIEDKKISIAIQRSARKSIALIIKNGKIIIKAPLYATDQTIDDFIESRYQWLCDHYREPLDLSIDYSLGRIMVFGRWRTVYLQPGKPLHVSITDEGIFIQALPDTSPVRINNALKKALKQELVNYIEAILPSVTAALQVNYRVWQCKKYTACWGKCTSNKDLFFAEKLIHTSKQFIEYVVVHECVHLIHFNHSKSFYACVEAIMPDYKTIIKANQSLLNKPL